ncbi:hypothetical protein GCM10027200_63400 [Lentzea nigeriaca]
MLVALALLAGCRLSPNLPTVRSGQRNAAIGTDLDAHPQDRRQVLAHPARAQPRRGNKQPGIFFRLKELVEDDEVEVSRKDGTTARFPTAAVHGETGDPRRRGGHADVPDQGSG